jgi:hypothetical protein
MSQTPPKGILSSKKSEQRVRWSDGGAKESEKALFPTKAEESMVPATDAELGEIDKNQQRTKEYNIAIIERILETNPNLLSDQINKKIDELKSSPNPDSEEKLAKTAATLIIAEGLLDLLGTHKESMLKMQKISLEQRLKDIKVSDPWKINVSELEKLYTEIDDHLSKKSKTPEIISNEHRAAEIFSMIKKGADIAKIGDITTELGDKFITTVRQAIKIAPDAALEAITAKLKQSKVAPIPIAPRPEPLSAALAAVSASLADTASTQSSASAPQDVTSLPPARHNRVQRSGLSNSRGPIGTPTVDPAHG